MELVVLIPSLGRPEGIKRVATAFKEVTPEARLYFILSAGDKDSHAAAKETGCDYCITKRSGYSAKVNIGVRNTEDPFILLAADDVQPHPGWFDIAKGLMTDKIGYVSLNDLGNRSVMRGRHATFPLVARWYAELDDELYHEGYQHNFCDNEASERAQQREAFAYAPRAIMEHLHVLWGKSELDQTYRDWALNEEAMAADRALYRSRRHLWAAP